jgi:hypothetical protein
MNILRQVATVKDDVCYSVYSASSSSTSKRAHPILENTS